MYFQEVYLEVVMTSDPYDDDALTALGSVVEEERGSLPFALIHGESLVACASWALGDSGVTPVDLGTDWSGLIASGEPVVLHDALCPMTPAAFIAECLASAVARNSVVVGVRPVTDTVKRVEDDVVGDTVDRTSFVAVASPVVLPATVVAALDGLPSLDFAQLVSTLGERFPVEMVEAPAAGRRVASEEDVRLLEALTSSG